MTHLPPSHADHDPLAIAAHAAGDATGPELDDALAMVAACGDCAVLHHDLRAIAAAMPDLPAPARTRDFRLTPEQAASLRPAGWRRLLAPFAGPKFAFAGPVGATLATLGLAGFLVAGSFGVPLAASAPDGGGAAASGAGDAGAVERTNSSGNTELFSAESPAAVALPAAEAPAGVPVPGVEAPAAGAPASAAPAGDAQGQVPVLEAGPAETAPADKMASGVAPDTEPVPVLPMLSAVVLLVGLTLAGLRFAGRRLVART